MNGKQARRRQQFAAIEEALRAALNGEDVVKESPPSDTPPTPPPPRRPHKQLALHQTTTTMRFNARNPWGGPSFVVEYSKKTISEFEVRLEAEADMARRRLIDVVHLETIRE